MYGLRGGQFEVARFTPVVSLFSTILSNATTNPVAKNRASKMSCKAVPYIEFFVAA
jgi:hypothetical protein